MEQHEERIYYFKKEIEKAREEIKKLRAQTTEEEKRLLEIIHAYRIESTIRILDFIKYEYHAGRICNLDLLLTHCANKLHGNIDGIDLHLENNRGVPFIKSEPQEDEE